MKQKTKEQLLAENENLKMKLSLYDGKTSDELKDIIEQYVKMKDEENKSLTIRSLVSGFEIANQMLLSEINNGKSIDELKKFVELNLTSGKDILLKGGK